MKVILGLCDFMNVNVKKMKNKIVNTKQYANILTVLGFITLKQRENEASACSEDDFSQMVVSPVPKA